MERLTVKSRHFCYSIVVGRGAWSALDSAALEAYSSVFILTEPALWRRWGRAFFRASKLKSARVIHVPSGEASKSLARVERIALKLAAWGADRRSLLIAFGGGVIGDLGGFVASTYMRGIDYLQVPTTVVAQVDSAIGGKTAVDVGAAKNLVGTFYPPRMVLAEPMVLSSLPLRTFRSGFYEVAKHALLSGPAFFTDLERLLTTLRPEHATSLKPLIARAAQVKVKIVNRDERESDLRRVLNLGHTFGHAIEAATGYRRLLHGEAVGWGLLGVTYLAERLGVLAKDEGLRIRELVRQIGPLPSISDLRPARVLHLLGHDKKTVRGQVHWVVPERIGKVRIMSDVPLETAAAAFRDLRRAIP